MMTANEIAALRNVLDEHRPRPGQEANVLRTLLAIQEVMGHVPVSAIQPIADALSVPETAIVGVLSYYPDLHSSPRGRHVIGVCLGEACLANRSADLLADLERILDIRLGETKTDGRTTLERVYCLGNCGVGPTVMVDERTYGRVSAADIQTIIKPAGS